MSFRVRISSSLVPALWTSLDSCLPSHSPLSTVHRSRHGTQTLFFIYLTTAHRAFFVSCQFNRKFGPMTRKLLTDTQQPVLKSSEKEKGKWCLSVMSDSLQPHGLQPTRLLHPWDFPGRGTGVGCHCLLLMLLNTHLILLSFNFLFAHWWHEFSLFLFLYYLLTLLLRQQLYRNIWPQQNETISKWN